MDVVDVILRDGSTLRLRPPERADALLALDETAYLAQLQAHLGSRVHLTAVGPRLRYPLLLRYRAQPVGARTVWLGNAAQTLHPVAGQGFNLALRDVGMVANLASNALDFRGTGRAGEGQLNLDGRFAWQASMLRGSLHLEGKNLLDEEYRVAGYDFGNTNVSQIGFYGPPRTVSVSATYRY